MASTLYHERFSTVDGSESRSKITQSRLGDQLDEIAVFALVAVALFYIAAMSCWFIM
ncbi:MAG TPA: hypothetical protein VK782_04250 [Candidatus Sulfotelmatobacter sp.]|nr:hypothetical protein [Candidatus Sulfotelmatobacter sp.]